MPNPYALLSLADRLIDEHRDFESGARVLGWALEAGAPPALAARQACAWLRCGDFVEALRAAGVAVERAPGAPESWNALGLAHAARGEEPQALEAYARSLERNPIQEEAYFNRGAVRLRSGAYDEALLDFVRAALAGGGGLPVRGRLGFADVGPLLDRLDRLPAGAGDGAAGVFRVLDPVARLLLDQRHPAPATFHRLRLPGRLAWTVPAVCYFAENRRSLGRTLRAPPPWRRYLEFALRLSPDEATLRYRRVAALQFGFTDPGGPGHATALAERHPESTAVAAWGAGYLCNRGRFEDALRLTERWARLAPEDLHGLALLRDLRARRGDAEGAAGLAAELTDRWRAAAEAGCPAAQMRIVSQLAREERDLPERLRWLRAAAECGDAGAQSWLADLFLSGYEVQPDRAESARWLRRLAARPRAGRAAYELGLLLLDVASGEPDRIEADAWLRRAAEAGDTKAQSYTGYRLVGDPRARPGEAETWLRKVVGVGEGDAAYNLAVCALRGDGMPQDPIAAVAGFQELASRGDLDAQVALAICRWLGHGLAADPDGARRTLEAAARAGHALARRALKESGEGDRTAAVPPGLIDAIRMRDPLAPFRHEARRRIREWHLRHAPILRPLHDAARRGDAAAAFRIGLVLSGGLAGHADPEGAAEHFLTAARAGHREAMVRLGRLLLREPPGTGGAGEAVEWFHRAAQAGDAEGQVEFGRVLRAAPGGAEEAVLWFLEAAEQGNRDAMRELGDCCRDGAGIPADPAAAEQWYRKAGGETPAGS